MQKMSRNRLFAGVTAAALACAMLLTACGTKDSLKVLALTPESAAALRFEEGWATTNNGQAKDGPEVERLISVVPSDLQYQYSKLEYYSFIHYGMNTFTKSEWGTGTESPADFSPKTVDTDQWVQALKASGSKGVIITAKHHDGFCLWPSAYTEHSVKNSPYQDGKGDIVKQMAESCKKYDMKLGIYLSPWDMHEPTYGTDAYNDYYVNQLTELCTNYGEIFSIWMDGARGEGIPGDFYDFDRYFEVIRALQPNCAISNVGPDVRWIGNESGTARESEWSVVSKGTARLENEANSQKTDEQALKGMDHEAADIGSREQVIPYRDLRWYPAEADVKITDGWFNSRTFTNPKKLLVNHHKNADELMKIYYDIVGGNASLLLNVAPNKNGVFPKKDVKTLQEFGEKITAAFAKPVAVQSVSTGSAERTAVGADASVLLTDNDDSYALSNEDYIIDLDLSGKQDVRRIVLREDIRKSQRVEAFDVYARVDGGYAKLASSTVIGSKRILNLDGIAQTDQIRIVIRQSRANPVLSFIGLYA